MWSRAVEVVRDELLRDSAIDNRALLQSLNSDWS